MIFLYILGMVVWYTTGIIANGFFLSYCQNKFTNIAARNWKSDRNFALLISILGPFCFIGLLGAQGIYSYGWMNPLGKNPHES